MTKAISKSWTAAVEAIAACVGKAPLPKTLITVTTMDWELVLNASNGMQWVEDIAPIPPHNILARHEKHLIYVNVGPFDSAFHGGISEADFVQEMQALMERVGDCVRI